MLPRFARLLTLVLAAIQFATPAVASVAEGVFVRRAGDPVVHIEEHGQKDCVPPHAADCAVCRYLAHNVGRAELPSVAIDLAIIRTTAAAEESFGSAPERQGFEARGPPALLG